MKEVILILLLGIFHSVIASNKLNPKSSRMAKGEEEENCQPPVQNQQGGVECFQREECKDEKVKSSLYIDGKILYFCCPEGFTNIRAGSNSINGAVSYYCECY